jgi:hypothetical protein
MRIFTALALILAGCTGDLVELGPKTGTGGSGGGGGSTDMAQGTSGGAAKFNPDIQRDIDSLGCSSGGCHGAGVKPALTMGASGAALDTNYTNFIGDCTTANPAGSPVLAKNLPGASHVGGAKFSGTSDPIYTRWLAWIQAGEPKQ